MKDGGEVILRLRYEDKYLSSFQLVLFFVLSSCEPQSKNTNYGEIV